MQAPKTTELSRIRAAYEDTFWDAGYLLTLTPEAGDGYDTSDDSWGRGDVLACRFYPAASREVLGGAQVVLTPARVKLPIDTTVSNQQRFELTKRHGEALSASEFYSIQGNPERGIGAIRLTLISTPDTAVRDE